MGHTRAAACGGPFYSSRTMKISGFSMARNAWKLYYPLRPAIESILPLVDEFVVAIGAGDEDDRTREWIAAIDSPKVKIIDTVWDLEQYPHGTENAHQTDIARAACIGDWLFYLQADEVVHENDLPKIRARCQQLVDDPEVEGLLFKYLHFWGDYQHVHQSHNWYKNEIRIIRNRSDIHSWVSAQSFRRIPNFDGLHYRQKEGTYRLKVAPVDAHIYHYGWVRPPRLMKKKMRALNRIHEGPEKKQAGVDDAPDFDYGPLGDLPIFRGTHPQVMQSWIEQLDWQEALYEHGPLTSRSKMKHETTKYKLLSWLENHILGGRKIGRKNYILLRR